MRAPKVQRWIDLLAALLSHRYPVTLAQLIAGVPAYQDASQKPDARRRMFERDKDELRALGILIETIEDGEEPAGRYRLKARNFYLPYLSLMAEGRPGKPRRLDKYGYASLPSLSFEPDELDAVAQAAARVRQLGDPLLADHAESAMRKLAVDLPLDVAHRADTRLAPARTPGNAETFAALGAALETRKRVTFEYRSMGADQTGRRTVEPFGLFFLNQHWYLAGRTPGEATVKNYRLSRIGSVEVNDRQAKTPDYDIPPEFRLPAHARSKHAWELGDGDAIVAEVRLRRQGGATAAAGRLGEPVSGQPDRRRFQVRRRDAFARWLLSFAGDLEPLSPPELVAEYRALVRATLAAHRGTPA
jgi:proteasome accessory factor B